MTLKTKSITLSAGQAGDGSSAYKVSYLDNQSGKDDLMVFLPGMGLDASDYQSYLTLDSVHGIALNLPGFGEGATEPPVRLDLHVRLISDVLTQLRLDNPGKRMALIGFSLGADMILRLAEFWQTEPEAAPKLHNVVLFDPNVNHSTMTISSIFANADPSDPLPVMKSVLQLPSDVDELRNVCTYMAKIATKDFAAITRYAQEFVAYWKPAGDYALIAQRLATLGQLTDHVLVVLSAAYATHLPQVEATLGGSSTNVSLVPTELDHFDLIAVEQLKRRLDGLVDDRHPLRP